MKRSREMAADGEFDLSRENLASDAKKLSKAKEGDIPVADRCSVLRATTLGADPFKFALNLFNQHILKPIEDAKKAPSSLFVWMSKTLIVNLPSTYSSRICHSL